MTTRQNCGGEAPAPKPEFFTRSYLLLCGGVGGSKLADGLARILPSGRLHVVVNTGDDFTHLGLRICPDLDTVAYMMAGLVSRERGWGREDESWSAMDALCSLGGPDWFQLGDRDLALHVLRSHWLRQGATLSEAMARVASGLGLKHVPQPMSDQAAPTEIETGQGLLPFQEYFVRQACRPVATKVHYGAADSAVAASPALSKALNDPDLAGVIIAPSNPILSIGPMLALAELRAFLNQGRVPAVAVSPFIGQAVVKGPAAKIQAELGLAPGDSGLCSLYAGWLSGLIVHADAVTPAPTGLPVPLRACNTLMLNAADRERVAREALDFLESLS
ncbi:YvcK family protein [Alcaligenaceae bacterium]|nr:YvcK family protein [Alcaligenaceae bacterium]